MSANAPKKRKVANRKKSGRRKNSRVESSARRKCGLCGATKNLIKTECCGQWICNDEDEYVMFSYAHNSCSRNHHRYTLCGIHFAEGHSGHWKDCEQCREEIVPEMYAYYGTNEYNFEVLETPPDFEPTLCSKCGAVIVLADGGYSYGREGYKCPSCLAAELPQLFF